MANLSSCSLLKWWSGLFGLSRPTILCVGGTVKVLIRCSNTCTQLLKIYNSLAISLQLITFLYIGMYKQQMTEQHFLGIMKPCMVT